MIGDRVGPSSDTRKGTWAPGPSVTEPPSTRTAGTSSSRMRPVTVGVATSAFVAEVRFSEKVSVVSKTESLRNGTLIVWSWDPPGVKVSVPLVGK